MSQSYYGSICLTDLIAKAKEQHPAYSKAQNGKIYVNINAWLNDEADKFGNVLSLQLSEKKDQKVNGKSFYIGNCKKSEYKEPQQLSKSDTADLDVDAPVRQSSGNVAEPLDDLPF